MSSLLTSGIGSLRTSVQCCCMKVCSCGRTLVSMHSSRTFTALKLCAAGPTSGTLTNRLFWPGAVFPTMYSTSTV